MPRSSRHKSHRERKRDARSDSEEEGNSRERRPRVEELAAGGSVARVSKDPELEKKKSSAKDVLAVVNSDEHGKKRKERGEDVVVVAVADRWNGGEGDDRSAEKRTKAEEFGPVDVEKSSRSKHSATDLKSKSSRRHEGSGEKNEESVTKVDLAKQRSEKDSSRRESGSSQYKDTKDRDRERGSDKDKKVQDARHEKPDDGTSKKDRSKRDDEDRKREGESAEWQIQDELHNPELEKELDKRMKKRRDGSGDKDKWFADGKDSDDKRLSSRDDRAKGGSYNDERHKDGAYRDKYREDIDKDQRHRDDRSSRDDRDPRHRDDRSSRDERDQRHRDDRPSRDDRDQRHRDDKHRDDHSSRDRTSDKSDGKHFREEKKPSESRYKKNKYHDSDHDGAAYVDDHISSKYKDDRGRKRFSDENDGHSDLKLRSTKESREDVEKTASGTSRFDPRADRLRPDYLRSDKVDPSLSNNQQGSSPSSTAHVKDQSRINSKQAESTHRSATSEEWLRLNTASTGDRACTSGVRDRAYEYRSLVKAKSKDDIHSELLGETATASQYDRTPRSDAYTSPNKLTEKSPSTSDRRLSDRTDSRRSLDVEEVGQKGSLKDVRDSSTMEEPLEKPLVGDRPQVELLNSEGPPAGSSSFNRTSHFSSSSPSHLPPPPPVRLGIDSPSVLGSYEDDRGHSGDRKSSGRYKRTGDFSMGRGQGSAWKGTPTWPSPVANGFIPFQHGPPPTGFHPNVQQFPAPPLFGVRPPMDLNHTGVPYHVHEAADRFAGHGRPFGWRNSVDDSCSPHLPVWDGSNGMFGDETHVYGRPEWDQSRPLIGSRGWEMNPDMWRGQNGNANMELPVPQKEPEYLAHALTDEAWGGPSGHRPRTERARAERLPAESSSIRRPNDTPPRKNAIEPPPKSLNEKTPEPIKTASAPELSRTSTDDNAICCAYLSRLDISLDLAHPELYKRCMSLLGTRDVTDACAVSKNEHPQNNKEETKVATSSRNYIINGLFPVTSDAVFQRAISLYKKSVGIKPKALASPIVCSKDEKGSLQGLDEKLEVADNHPSDDTSLANAEEGNNASTDVENGLPGDDAKERSSDLITDAVIFYEGSESCEAFTPECRVNLSRIPNSPESTH